MTRNLSRGTPIGLGIHFKMGRLAECLAKPPVAFRGYSNLDMGAFWLNARIGISMAIMGLWTEALRNGWHYIKRQLKGYVQ